MISRRPLDRTGRRRISADIAERSYIQWKLIRALVFGERDWIVISSVLFMTRGDWEFFSLAGITVFVLGLFFSGPLFGMALFLTMKAVYLLQKSKGNIPENIRTAKRQSWIINLCWLPLFFAASWAMMDLFYDSWDSFSGLFRLSP